MITSCLPFEDLHGVLAAHVDGNETYRYNLFSAQSREMPTFEISPCTQIRTAAENLSNLNPCFSHILHMLVSLKGKHGTREHTLISKSWGEKFYTWMMTEI